MQKVSRDEQLRRSAEMRTAISSLLFNSSENLPASEISELLKSKMEELGYNETNLSNFLFTMSKNGLISKSGPLGNVKYGRPSDIKSAEPVKIKKPKGDPAQEIKIDIVKSTGRVRLQIKGLVIEIGVVD